MKKSEIVPLTSLRAFAAWWVMTFHTGYLILPLSAVLYQIAQVGHMGVELFFVLSGFVIAYNYMDSGSRPGPSRWRAFYWARFARLYPVHLFTLLLALAMFVAIRAVHLHTAKDFSDWTVATFLENLFMVQQWVPFPVFSWNDPAWSISCEWFAYLLFPFFVMLGLRRAPAVFSLAAAPVVAMLPEFLDFARPNLPFINLLRVALEFLSGCMIYVAWTRLKDRAWVRHATAASVLAGAAAWILVDSLATKITAFWLIPLFPLLVMFLAVCRGPVERIMCSRFLAYWGRVSYSLYMTHGVTLWVLKTLLPEHNNRTDALRLAVYVLVISVAAALTYHFIEEPSRRRLRELVREPKSAPTPEPEPAPCTIS